MSVFSSVFREGMALLAETSGELVTYEAPDGSRTSATVLVGNEVVEPDNGDRGIEFVRKREFTFQISEVDPGMYGTVVYAGEEWAVVGERNRSASAVRVICTRQVVHEHSRPGLRVGAASGSARRDSGR